MPRTLWRSITNAWPLLWPILHSRHPRRSRNCRPSKSSCKFTFRINCRSRDRHTKINSSCRIHNIGLSSVAIRIRSNLSTFMQVHPPIREFCCYKHLPTRSTALREPSLMTSSNTSAMRQNVLSFGTFPKIAYNNYAYVSQWEETRTTSRELIS